MLPILPLYFCVAPAQLGGVAPDQRPQSLITTSSFCDSGFVPSESLMFDFATLNVPLSVPVFLMSTVLVVAGSPGLIPLAVRMAALSFEFSIDSEPVENVFDGFADAAVKFAPEPTATAAAASRAASAPRR